MYLQGPLRWMLLDPRPKIGAMGVDVLIERHEIRLFLAPVGVVKAALLDAHHVHQVAHGRRLVAVGPEGLTGFLERGFDVELFFPRHGSFVPMRK